MMSFFGVDVRKSTGRLLTLLHETRLPLRRYSKGSVVLYTTEPFGPRPGLEIVYDWHRSSPVLFTQRHVDHALEAGLVEPGPVKDTFVPSFRGSKVAPDCVPIWGPEFDAYFNRWSAGALDWRRY
jgi:hypothetical protein